MSLERWHGVETSERIVSLCPLFPFFMLVNRFALPLDPHGYCWALPSTPSFISIFLDSAILLAGGQHCAKDQPWLGPGS